MDKFIQQRLFDAQNRTNKGFNEVLKVCKELKSDIPMHSENEKRLNELIESIQILLHQINVDFQTVYGRYGMF